MSRFSRLVRLTLFTFLAGIMAQFVADSAEARAGRSRSMGKSSRPAQSEQYRSGPQQGYQSQPAAAPAQQRGGFGRALAGGIAGGFLGSMLFSSLGNAAPGVGGAGAGGFGLIEIILVAGLAFLAFRWWKSRQLKTATANGAFARSGAFGQSYPNVGQAAPATQTIDVPATGGISSEEASDIFFRVQGAFTRRDLRHANEILTPDMYRELNADLEQMKVDRRINKLENISVRRVEVLDRWNESGVEYARVRFNANLLDYTVDETSGQVLEGSAHEPVKFEEDWTFARSGGYAPWQLAGIAQV